MTYHDFLAKILSLQWSSIEILDLEILGGKRRRSGPNNFQFRQPRRPAYFVRKTTSSSLAKSQQHMKVHVGSDEIFSSFFFARSFESLFIHLLLTKRCHIFQFINTTSVLAIGKFTLCLQPRDQKSLRHMWRPCWWITKLSKWLPLGACSMKTFSIRIILRVWRAQRSQGTRKK